MSVIDNAKSAHEEYCLKEAIRLAASKKSKTGEIMQYLNGEIIARGKNDRPDIICRCEKGKKNPQTVYVGIEHFLVDQVSIQQAKKLVSKDRENREYLNKLRDKAQDHISSGNDIPEKIESDFADGVFNLAQCINESGYNSLLNAFQVHLQKHLSSVPQYRINVEKLAGESPVEIAFLIEIKCNFDRIFLNNGQNISENKNGLMPMFQGVVDLLAQISTDSVDYIVLYIRNTIKTNNADVIAIRTGHIKKHLENQGIPVYPYYSESLDSKIKKNDHIIDDDGNHQIIYQIIHRNVDNIDYLMPGLKKAYEAKKKGLPFAATRSIQLCLYALGQNIMFTKNRFGHWDVTTQDSKEKVLKRLDAFCERFPIRRDTSNV